MNGMSLGVTSTSVVTSAFSCRIAGAAPGSFVRTVTVFVSGPL
jgi:hypothetical protein